MRKLVRVILFMLVFIIIAVVAFLVLKTSGEQSLTNQGNKLVEKVELYKIKYKKLPATLEEAGADNTTDDSLYYYQKRADSINYEIWYGTSLDESKIYYSDSKQWEDHNR